MCVTSFHYAPLFILVGALLSCSVETSQSRADALEDDSRGEQEGARHLVVAKDANCASTLLAASDRRSAAVALRGHLPGRAC